MPTINLALQGGGAHGAFTWGALERLLDEPDITIEGITATSAGAMNAAALKSGLAQGSNAAAQEALRRFWSEVSGLTALVPDPVRDWISAVAPPLPMINAAAEMSPAFLSGEYLSRAFSPYVLNPAGIHPLRNLVESFGLEQIDMSEGPRLFIGATNVRTGKIRVFKSSDNEITTDTILASATLPTLSKAIEIHDATSGRTEAFWDGGYMGNPPLFPLYYETQSRDILIIHINPIERPNLPKTARDIDNRINEISFNASLLAELRSIRFVKRLIAEGKITADDMRDLNIHSLADDDTMRSLSVATKLTPTPALIESLRAKGHAAMSGFLAKSGGQIGKTSTCDLDRLIG